MQGSKTPSTFADRFHWARKRAGYGANTLSRSIGCSQSLISNIENGDRSSSKYNDAFADIFGVGAKWLRTGEGPAPVGFDAVEARKMRTDRTYTSSGAIVPFPAPRVRAQIAEARGAETDAERADALQKAILGAYQDYVVLVGPERTKAFLEVLERLNAILGVGKKADRDDKGRSA